MVMGWNKIRPKKRYCVRIFGGRDFRKTLALPALYPLGRS